MKICDVTQFYSEVGGGVKRYLHEKRHWVRQQGVDEHILIVPGAETRVQQDGPLTLCTIRSPKLDKTSRYRLLLNLPAAEDMIVQARPDIIESGDPYHLGWRTIHIADRLGIPAVGFYHSHFPEAYLRTVLKFCGSWVRDVVLAYSEDYIRNLYNHFDRTLVPSHFLVDILRSWGVTNTARVRLGVDLEAFYPGPANPATRIALQIPADAPFLLYVGRLSGDKNTRTLLAAWKLLAHHLPHLHFLIVGDGALRDLVRAAQSELPNLRWIAHCADSSQLGDYYRAATLFVHPGVCETFGLVTMEAQACACPVVGIRGSYMDANIFAGLDLWAEENTPEALAAAIHRFLKADFRELGQRAARAVRASFSWNQVLGDIRAIYQETITEKKARIRAGGLLHV